MSSAKQRELIHTRSILAQGFRIENDLFEIEVSLRDTKSFDRVGPAETRPAGQPIHDMTLCLTVDRQMNIVAVSVNFSSVPYVGSCESIASKYQSLVGMALKPGFSSAAREIFGGNKGCAHMTELVSIAATTAYQTIGKDRSGATDANKKPFQLDRCHALRSDGEVVAKYYPRWASSSVDRPVEKNNGER